MRLHITDAMIDAAVEAFKSEALKDGYPPPDIPPDGQQMKRFREVVRIALQAAAGAI